MWYDVLCCDVLWCDVWMYLDGELCPASSYLNSQKWDIPQRGTWVHRLCSYSERGNGQSKHHHWCHEKCHSLPGPPSPQAMVLLAPKLDSSVLNNQLLKYLAKCQMEVSLCRCNWVVSNTCYSTTCVVDTTHHWCYAHVPLSCCAQAAIRTNTTICISKIAQYLDTGVSMLQLQQTSRPAVWDTVVKLICYSVIAHVPQCPALLSFSSPFRLNSMCWRLPSSVHWRTPSLLHASLDWMAWLSLAAATRHRMWLTRLSLDSPQLWWTPKRQSETKYELSETKYECCCMTLYLVPLKGADLAHLL